MGDAADDLRDREEDNEDDWREHRNGRCAGYPHCGYCLDPDMSEVNYNIRWDGGKNEYVSENTIRLATQFSETVKCDKHGISPCYWVKTDSRRIEMCEDCFMDAILVVVHGAKEVQAK